ncbi:Rubisco accumulation factor 1 [Heracleum sosnowskyi]|uniref:Rubisco accumulation factor 1 n=1 Tax=Heracleum sosnowskyi TaxID=360622 RepID=A0AAD8GQQ5_9APIA|nr:Rubisco accumulation factor 1 [Heracleum sosnowskyi]
MLSSSISTPRFVSTSTPLLPPSLPHFPLHKIQCISRPVIDTTIPSTPTPQTQVYQPFRPPPSPVPPQFRSLDANARLEILSNRLGLWFEYAPLIPSLTREGFAAPTIEEVTGLTGVEQNQLIVGCQVRDSLVQSKLEDEVLAFFDLGGAQLLYEIRLLSVSQRAKAARLIANEKFDVKSAQELARAIKDYPRRKKEKGWECFEYTSPRDCLAFMYYRLALEHQSLEPRELGLEKALEMAETERAKNRILKDLRGKSGDGVEEESVAKAVKVPVVRMKVGEVSEATSVAVLPVCRSEEREKEVVDAPWECGTAGEFGVVVAEKPWSRWVVLPGWEPVVGLKRGGVVVGFSDARALPWKVNRWYKEESILVVADRKVKQVTIDDGFYLVCKDDGLKVQRGSALKELGVAESLGTVVLVVRPPREDTENQLEEDWE